MSNRLHGNRNNLDISGYTPYRWCIVPECKNCSVKTPRKLWIKVPTDLDMRRTWLNLASIDSETLVVSQKDVYFCGDHFDLRRDMETESYRQYRRRGRIKKICMKPNCVPSRFDCQTNSGTSIPGDPYEPLFDVNKPNCHSFVSLEEPKMSNLLSPMKTEDDSLNEDITEPALVPTLFCICCLKKEVPLVNLLTCLHADFLNSLMMPEIKPHNQVICYECHVKLKKIKLFKLQVEKSFKLLSNSSTENTPKFQNQRHNLKIRQVLKIDIPQTNFNNIDNPETVLEDATELDDIKQEEKEFTDNKEKSPPPKSLQNKNMNNIEEAIRIINNNQNSDCISFLANSLQSISHSLFSELGAHSLLSELGGQNDRNPTEIIINVNTAPTTTVNPTENITNYVLNENLNTIDNTENMDEEEIGMIISDNVGAVENVDTEELNQAVTKKECIDVGESNDMQTEETWVPLTLDKRPSLGSNIKQLTLTREQLMQERKKIATSQSYLRAPHRCESCLIGFQFQENIEDHVKRKHITSGKRFTVQCDVCLQFVEHGAQNMHMFWHYTRYECVACAEKFASYDKAALHYRKNHHRGKSSICFKCPHCPYKTDRKSTLTAHLKAYTKCKHCGDMLGCAKGNKLKLHMRHCVGAKLKTVSKAKKAKTTSTTRPILKKHAPDHLKKETTSDNSEK